MANSGNIIVMNFSLKMFVSGGLFFSFLLS